MKLSVASFLTLCGFAGLSACASPNVYHFNSVLEQQKNVKAVDVYLDAYGMRYPPTGIAYDYLPELKYEGELQRAATDPQSRLCQTNIGGDLGEMCSSGASEWDNIQTQLWTKTVTDISKLFSDDSKNKALVVLIHGFNVDDAQRDYRIAQARIRELNENGTDFVFLRVHWDGSKNPVLTRAWSKAQYSGPLVGFRMREFYNILSENNFGHVKPSVHVLTHSSGAFITTATFGNPISALPRLSEKTDMPTHYDDFKKSLVMKSEKRSIPQIENLRIGMLAPAIPSDSVLNFSVNPKDEVLSNLGFVSANFSFLGAKGVGAKKETFCFIADWEGKRSKNTTVSGFDFTRTQEDQEQGVAAKSHSFSDYLTQNASTLFLKQFLGYKVQEVPYINCD